MSYILDALKQSDRERKQGEIPSLQTIHADQISIRRKRAARRQKLILTVGLCSLAVLTVGIWRWSIADKPQVAEQPAPQERTAPAPAPETLPSPPPVQTIAPQILEPVRNTPAPEPGIPAGSANQPAEVVIEPAPLMQTAPRRDRTLPRAANEQDSSIPLLKDLPADRQQALSKTTLAGHVYAEEPSRRMIMINNKIVREGDMVGENLRLVRITWDGVILRHIDTEFQMKLQ